MSAPPPAQRRRPDLRPRGEPHGLLKQAAQGIGLVVGLAVGAALFGLALAVVVSWIF